MLWGWCWFGDGLDGGLFVGVVGVVVVVVVEDTLGMSNELITK